MGESSQFQLLLQYATRKEIVGGDAVQVGGDNLCCRESVVHGQQVARVHDETFAVLQCGGSGVRDDDIGLIGGCNLVPMISCFFLLTVSSFVSYNGNNSYR